MILQPTFRRLLAAAALLLLASVARGDDRIIVNVRVNGHPLRFAFDTGAGAPYILLRNVADSLGIGTLPAPPGTPLGPGEVRSVFTVPTRFEMFGRTFDNAQARVIAVPTYLPYDIQGFIGWPALRNTILALRMSENVIEIVDKVPLESEGWVRLRLRPDLDTLCIELPVAKGGQSRTVLVDTGDADAVHLSSGMWRRWSAVHARRPRTLEAYYTPGDGLVVVEKSWANVLSLGGIVLHDVAVMESNPAEAEAVGAGYEATLGLAALRRLDLVIDGKAGNIYVRSRTDPPQAYSHNRLGAVFVPRDPQGSDLIAHVAPGSPAEAAGIRDGDILLKIDQLDVSNWKTQPGILPLSRFFDQPSGTELILTVGRKGTPVRVPVMLQEILGRRAPV